MNSQSFSQRYGLVPHPEPQAQDHLPPWVREEFVKLLRQFTEEKERQRTQPLYSADVVASELYELLKPYVWKVLDRRPPGNPMRGPFAYYIPNVIEQCQWSEFYDICDDMYKLFVQTYGRDEANIFAERVNGVFAREGVVWRFKNGLIERDYNPVVNENIEESRALLKDPRFQGPNEQFEKARKHLDKRPEPDVENCVKDAVGALEGVAQTLAKKPSGNLKTILGGEPFKTRIPGALREALLKIEGYRGDASGAGHAMTAGKPKIEVSDAELVLTTCAAGILFLISKVADTD